MGVCKKFCAFPLLKKRFAPIGEENAELEKNLPQIMNVACPLEHDILRDEIEHFQKRLVTGEYGFTLCDLSKLPVVAFNHVSGVYNLSDFPWGI